MSFVVYPSHAPNKVISTLKTSACDVDTATRHLLHVATLELGRAKYCTCFEPTSVGLHRRHLHRSVQGGGPHHLVRLASILPMRRMDTRCSRKDRPARIVGLPPIEIASYRSSPHPEGMNSA